MSPNAPASYVEYQYSTFLTCPTSLTMHLCVSIKNQHVPYTHPLMSFFRFCLLKLLLYARNEISLLKYPVTTQVIELLFAWQRISGSWGCGTPARWRGITTVHRRCNWRGRSLASHIDPHLPESYSQDCLWLSCLWSWGSAGWVATQKLPRLGDWRVHLGLVALPWVLE